MSKFHLQNKHILNNIVHINILLLHNDTVCYHIVEGFIVQYLPEVYADIAWKNLMEKFETKTGPIKEHICMKFVQISLRGRIKLQKINSVIRKNIWMYEDTNSLYL